ncbi:MAG: O-antigen ligase family protein [Planctomycetales bacterium]|nr:O-antigen ligase family protein [Planctomycetales bacterium]
MNDQYRRTLTYILLGIALVSSAAYDTVFMQVYERVQQGLAGLMALCFGGIIFIQRYSLKQLGRAFADAWPLHVYSVVFLVICFAFHGGYRLPQVLAYTYFAYATYFMLPFIFREDQTVFQAFIRQIAWLSALLAIPSFFGAAGFDRLGGIRLRNKPSYAEFSGIIASGGFFEHPEGHALQMGFGILCAIYLLQRSGTFANLAILILTTLGLIVSQGRAAIYGLCIAAAFHVLPSIFRRSRLVFIGTFALLLLFPYVIWPQMSQLPGISSYLRMERGLSGRGEAWEFAADVIREKPATGHGFMASATITWEAQRYLRRTGFSGAGTTFHNTFISKAVDFGLVATGLYMLLYIVPLWRICPEDEYRLERELIRGIIVLTITTAIYRDYNIGGVRSTVVIGAIFLGLASIWHSVVHRAATSQNA